MVILLLCRIRSKCYGLSTCRRHVGWIL